MLGLEVTSNYGPVDVLELYKDVVSGYVFVWLYVYKVYVNVMVRMYNQLNTYGFQVVGVADLVVVPSIFQSVCSDNELPYLYVYVRPQGKNGPF